MKFCTIEGMEPLLSIGRAQESIPTASDHRDAAQEAAALAQAAYDEGREEAIHQVERLLYVIHTHSGFGPPVYSIPGLCWSILMNWKLKTTLGRLDVAPEVGADEMVKRLDAAIQQVEQRDHSLLDIITRAQDMKGLHVYTKNWFASTHGFTKQLFAIVRNCHGIPEFKHIFETGMENVNEECDPSAPHSEMRARFPRRLGLEYTSAKAVRDPEQVTTAFSLQNYRTGICNLVDPTFALGSFYTIEAVFPGVCSRMYSGLKARGFEDEAIEIFKSHSGKDTEHANEWLSALRDSPLSPKQRAQVLKGGLAQIELRHQMFVEMRRLLA